jgi:hypothetical protein
MTPEKPLPFYHGAGAVPYDLFTGRDDLRDKFASLTWNRSAQRQDYVMVIEGRTSFGKSSFAKWCKEAAIKNSPDKSVMVALSSLAAEASQPIASREDFYKFLTDEFYKNFSGTVETHKIRWKFKQARLNVGRFIEKLHEVELGGWNVTRLLKFTPENPAAFFKFIDRLNANAKSKMKAYVIIVDNVSLSKRGPQLCGELLMALKEPNENGWWPPDFPNVVLILLPLPTWDEAETGARLTLDGVDVKRRIDNLDKLAAFDIAEVDNFVRGQCAKTAWTYDNKRFIPSLYYMSGGIPILLQRIGFAACQKSKLRNSLELSSDDVMAAVRSAELKADVENRIRATFGFIAEKYLDTEEDKKILPMFYRIEHSDKVEWEGQIPNAITGMSRNAWKKRVLAQFSKSLSYENSFSKIWNALVAHGIVLQRDGDYYFCAEVVRRYLNQFDP